MPTYGSHTMCTVQTSLDAESNNNFQRIRWQSFRGGVVQFGKTENTHTNAPQRHITLQTISIEEREGKAAVARKMTQGAAASSPSTAVLFVRAGARCWPDFEKPSEEEMPCPGL